MDSLNLKFNNFKSFIKEIVPPHARFDPLIIQLEQAPVGIFLTTLHQKRGEDKINVIKDLLKQMSLDIKEIDPMHLEKFLRYIDYFIQVAGKLL
jgi:hypothetical protein